mmetsp:Transcript_5707/g.21573  ORF Transcript_5707/g.21573 Transcript_5707/m.21573 type:complete len:844 (-) Transcript_5707:876-3407(-)|eukprot:CAMPEP_0117446938 /NCGR_PEP_ID=MMETSP0759-20121206/6608_1 /TAXON_ID=63605 /ORGANISM="Percolomonas cosmopolitus, Strain WS" /LENGTH=843 /DNA_ID=CAMNT_0005239239 /DNA_START=71 /DNA_END=2602 /DNA_ORIENTATION=+
MTAAIHPSSKQIARDPSTGDFQASAPVPQEESVDITALPIPYKKVSQKAKYSNSIFRRCSSLCFCILFGSIAPLIVLTIVLLSINFTMEKGSALNFSHDFLDQTSAKIKTQMDKTMTIPPMSVHVMGNRFLLQKATDDTPFQDLAPIFFDAFQATKAFPVYLSYMYVETEDTLGRAFGVIDGGMVLALEKGFIKFAIADIEAGTFNLSEPVETTPSKAEDALWYQAMKTKADPQAPRIQWTPPYFEPLIPESFFVTCYNNLFNETNHWLGVVAMDYTLTSLTNYLVNEAETSRSGVVFIVDAQGNLVASSDPLAPPILSSKMADGSFNTQQVKGEESTSDLIKYSTKYIKETTGSYLGLVNAQEQIRISVPNHGSVLLNYTSFSAPQSTGIDWIIVLASPEEDFMDQITRSRTIFGSVAGILFLIGIFIASCTSCCITYPLHSLRKEMKKVESMKLDSIRAKKSFFYEIYSIQRSFYFMKEKLELYRTYLPDTIFEEDRVGTEAGEEDITSVSDTASARDNGSVCSDNKSEISHRTSSSSHGKAQGSSVVDLMALGVTHRRASSLSLKLNNASELSHNPQRFIMQHGSLLEKARITASRTRGTLDNISCDSLHMCFNALTVNKQHPTAAIKSAIMLRDHCKSHNIQMGNAKRLPVDVSLGIATEVMVAGNVGYEQYRQCRAFGTARTLSNVLAEISSKDDRRPLLISREAHALVSAHHYKMIPYGIYWIQDHKEVVFVYEVIGLKHSQSAEWLYNYGRDEKQSLMNRWNRVVDQLAQDRTPKVDLTELEAHEETSRVRLWAEFLTRLEASDKIFSLYVESLNAKALCTNGVRWIDLLCVDGSQ